MLAIQGLNQFYSGSHILWDVNLEVPEGLVHLPHGPQWHGQDHAAQMHHGSVADRIRRA